MAQIMRLLKEETFEKYPPDETGISAFDHRSPPRTSEDENMFLSFEPPMQVSIQGLATWSLSFLFETHFPFPINSTTLPEERWQMNPLAFHHESGVLPASCYNTLCFLFSSIAPRPVFEIWEIKKGGSLCAKLSNVFHPRSLELKRPHSFLPWLPRSSSW